MSIKDPAFNYDKFGGKYSTIRKTDPRIEKIIHDALGPSGTVINVGAGTGSYEPKNRYVVAVEPSSVMRAQRGADKVPALNAKGDSLSFDDNSFDAAMAMVTIHHWPDIPKGLKELRRVAKERVLILTFDPDRLKEFWNINYFPELVEIEAQRYRTIDMIAQNLGGKIEVIRVPVPLDCMDGFQEAYYGRPEYFLKKEVRAAQSAWGFLPPGKEDELVKRLKADLDSGEWDQKYGHLRSQPFFEGSLTLIVSRR